MIHRRTSVRPRIDDLVRGVGAGRGPVRDVDARTCGQVVTRSRDAVHDASADDGIERIAGVVDREQDLRLRPRLSAVERADQLVSADPR